MDEEPPERPPEPDLPTYLVEPLAKQSPERLETVAAYARRLAEWKRHRRQHDRDRRRAADAVGEAELAALRERGVSTDPTEYEDVPASGAYVTVKTTKRTDERSYRYYYWQWREGDAWKNAYIAPVGSDRTRSE
ncbi:hypothetical protein [Salinigranum marinum]|uniref:hypothetical protein n=1 Tax=Salinigranum marinum TaxID=1515595 RepID=UPI002989EA6A|nr:hypothetical protein [Salinigranum marinum]